MRYQFDCRAHVSRPLRLTPELRHLLKVNQGINPREAFPMMLRQGTKGASARYWLGTNQPRTVTFSAIDDAQARMIAVAHGEDDWFVWNIDLAHYV